MPQPLLPDLDEGALEPAALVAWIETAARAQNFRVERFGQIGDVPQIALTKRTPGPRPRIYLSAGIHGDEPAPPYALLDLIERGVFDARAVWFICPLLNPAGFLRRTRENEAGIDLNRDYKTQRSREIQAHARWLQSQPNFDLALCLHEDWEAQGFYLYELNPTARPSRAHDIIQSVAAVLPIETATIIDGRAVTEPGIIRPEADPLLRDDWPESLYLRAHHMPLSYTLETPSTKPLATRRAALQAAVETAIVGLVGPREDHACGQVPPSNPDFSPSAHTCLSGP